MHACRRLAAAHQLCFCKSTCRVLSHCLCQAPLASWQSLCTGSENRLLLGSSLSSLKGKLKVEAAGKGTHSL
jgi:hypothetical protein